MDAYERRGGMDVTHHQGHGFFFAALGLTGPEPIRVGLEVSFEAVDAEVSPASGKVGFGDLLYRRNRHTSIISC
jgi:hypothetical protein